MRNVTISREGYRTTTDRDAYTHYRTYARHRDISFMNHLSTYKKVINSFYKKVSRDLIENEGGVFIKGLGYFSILAHPKRQIVKVPYQKEPFANFKTNNYLFTPSFFGVVKGNPMMNFWCMDRTFSRVNVKKRLHKALISGKRYKTYISSIYSLYLFKKDREE